MQSFEAWSPKIGAVAKSDIIGVAQPRSAPCKISILVTTLLEKQRSFSSGVCSADYLHWATINFHHVCAVLGYFAATLYIIAISAILVAILCHCTSVTVELVPTS